MCLNSLSAFRANRGRTLLDRWTCRATCASPGRGRTYLGSAQPGAETRTGFAPAPRPHPPSSPRHPAPFPSSRRAGCGVPGAPRVSGGPHACGAGPAPGPSGGSLAARPPRPDPPRPRARPAPRSPSFPGTSGGRRAQKRSSPRESSIPPLQLLSPAPAGEGGWLPAPARSPASGLPASAPARRAWSSAAAAGRERTHCTTPRLAHSYDERSRRVGGEALLPLPVLKGLVTDFPSGRQINPPSRQPPFSWEPPSTFAPVPQEAPGCHLPASPRHRPRSCSAAGLAPGRSGSPGSLARAGPRVSRVRPVPPPPGLTGDSQGCKEPGRRDRDCWAHAVGIRRLKGPSRPCSSCSGNPRGSGPCRSPGCDSKSRSDGRAAPSGRTAGFRLESSSAATGGARFSVKKVAGEEPSRKDSFSLCAGRPHGTFGFLPEGHKRERTCLCCTSAAIHRGCYSHRTQRLHPSP